jgi:hypothetical protein
MDTEEVFVYMGEGGARAPQNVVRVRVDPSVTLIPAYAFVGCKQLIEVEMCEGLVEIGDWAFASCGHSIMKIIIFNSLRRINEYAFSKSL